MYNQYVHGVIGGGGAFTCIVCCLSKMLPHRMHSYLLSPVTSILATPACTKVRGVTKSIIVLSTVNNV